MIVENSTFTEATITTTTAGSATKDASVLDEVISKSPRLYLIVVLANENEVLECSQM